MRNPKVVHLTTAHQRFDTRIFRKQCRSLARESYDVFLIVADGLGDQVRDGVKFRGVPKARSRLRRMTLSVFEVLRASLAIRGDIYHVHDPELLPAGLILKAFGKRVVYDAHENVASQLMLKEYLTPWLRGALASSFTRIERTILRFLDGVVTATASQVEQYAAITAHVVSVENFADINELVPNGKGLSRVSILHAGSISEARGALNMMRLASMLGERGEIVLAGPVASNIRLDSTKNLRYVGVLDQHELVEAYRQSNLGLILYNDIGQYGGATAVKLYEYMAAGVPVIVPSHGEWPKVVASVGCGIAVDVQDVAQQIAAVDWLRSNEDKAREMGESGRRYVMANASWESAFRKLELLYTKILD